MFDLPAHTPTPALIYTLGTLYTNHRVEQKRFIYLHRILNRSSQHWTRQTLDILDSMDIGWAKSVKEALLEYDLPTNFMTIKTISLRQWIKIVKQKVETKNLKRLKDDCHKTQNGFQVPKRKTEHILKHLSHDRYQRKPNDEILLCTKQETKTLIIARFGMLECGYNFKAGMSEECNQCNVLDNEDHRLNYCVKFKGFNYCNSSEKVNFEDIYSNDMPTLRKTIPLIERVWNTKCAHGTMNK